MSNQQSQHLPQFQSGIPLMRYASGVTESEAGAGSISGFSDEMGAGSDQLFFVSAYTDFERLAHGPRGTEAKHSLYVYRFHPSDGSLVLLHITDQSETETVINPAFSRYHPRLNVVYTCTEDIDNNGQIFAYSISPNGMLSKISQADAGGTSTCYLTIDQAQQNMLAVNYWNSTLTVIPICSETGEFKGPIKSIYDPNDGREMMAAGKKHGGVNHSHNDESTIRQRQADPHSHALVLDPFVGCVAYVPDLGKDLVRELLYDKVNGEIKMELNVLPSGLCSGSPDGPRYFEFHPIFNAAYVVNELSSTIAVFSVDRARLEAIARASKLGLPMENFQNGSTLKLIQSISTVPEAFPKKMNTCGRVCVHPTGRFVIVSNRGHESITIFRVHQKGSLKGKLRQVGFFHTLGETPRHFQFDSSGQYLIVANQDSDSISVFSFNLSSGEIKFTGNTYHVPSPNFVCCCPIHPDGDVFDNPQERTPGNTLTSEEARELREVIAADRLTVSNYDSENPAEDSSDSEGKVIINHGPWFGGDKKKTKQNTESNKALMAELEAAKEEIRQLQQQLSTLTSNKNSSPLE